MSQSEKTKNVGDTLPEKIREDVSLFGRAMAVFTPQNVAFVKGHIYALDQEPVKKPGSSNIAKKLGL